MKNKKLFLPAIILAVAILAIVAYSLISSIAQTPAVTEEEFPFSITYELDGETVTIHEIYKVRYSGNDGYADTKTCTYVGEIGDRGEDNTIYILKQDENTRIELWTQFYADYMMGDTQYDYFDGEDFKPMIYYFDAEETAYHDEETLAAQGVKLISFDYPTPIENSFVFSHLSYFSGAVVLPTLLIALLALAATIIFVKKEKDSIYKTIDIVSIVFNCVIGSIYLAFVTIVALLIDITGGGPELYYQIMYFIPAGSVLCITASVALRRKGYGKSGLITQFVGPAVFAVYLLVCFVCGLL
jgi:hypothetical protein